MRSFPGWHVYISSRLHDTEYAAGRSNSSRPARTSSSRTTFTRGVDAVVPRRTRFDPRQRLLDLEEAEARVMLALAERYPIFITRRLADAKRWLKDRARVRAYGIIASSEAQRASSRTRWTCGRLSTRSIGSWTTRTTSASYYLERRRHRIPRPGPRTGLGLRDVGRRLPPRPRVGALVILRQPLEPNPVAATKGVSQKRLPRPADPRASRHGDLRTRRGRRRPNPPSRVL